MLGAALRQGVILPYSCKNGTCASCKCALLDGEIRYPYNPPAALSTAEIRDGLGLACQAVPAGDLTIEAREIEQVAEIPVRKFPVRVEERDQLTPEIMRLRLKLPRGRRLQFLAGQYLDVLLPEDKRRAFSFASPPSEQDFIELHVRHIEGGGFTGHVFSDMREREILRCEGPLGTFFVRTDSDRPMLMVAGGTGFAPLKGMIEDLIHAGDTRPLTLYRGVRAQADLYAQDLIGQWKHDHPAFDYIPVLSEPDKDWAGRTGLVHEAVLADHPDPGGFDVYMSGPPAMIHVARPAFLEAGVPEDRLFYDSFDFGPDVPPAPDED